MAEPFGDMFTEHVTDMPTLTRFLNHAVRRGASDIFLQSGRTPRVLVNQRMEVLAPYKLQTDQVETIGRIIADGHVMTTSLAQRRDYDTAFNVPDTEATNKFGVPKRQRFRLNATSCIGRDIGSSQIVLRSIESDPPTLDYIRFPDEVREHIALEQGAFLIAGETGSGKTTTFAACIRYILEGNTPISGNIVTYEAPVEYLFTDIESDTCLIAQTEIPTQLLTFSDALVNAMRRKPKLIVVGETRDKDTILAAITAANTGHPLYATVHANNSAVIIRRMYTMFDMNQQMQVFNDLCLNARILMSQVLVPRVGGGVVCLRDWCLLDPKRAEELIEAGPSGHVRLLMHWMDSGDRARSMRDSIIIEQTAGTISEEVAKRQLRRFGYLDLIN